MKKRNLTIFQASVEAKTRELDAGGIPVTLRQSGYPAAIRLLRGTCEQLTNAFC